MMSFPHEFSDTQWSLVLMAGREDTPRARQALGSLCQAYWWPLYSYARRRGRVREEAEDLTQEFFLRLIERSWLEEADPARGRFRNFLLKAMEHFINKEWQKSQARKRGGGLPVISLDAGTAEARYAQEATVEENATPERAFDVRWAQTVVALARQRIAQEFGAHPMGSGLLLNYLAGDRGGPPFSEAAATAGVTEGALKSAVRRLRVRFGQLVREEVARTVADPGEVDDEMRHLLSVLGG